MIAPGPLTGLYLPGAAKTALVALAPLTGIYGESNMGGNFGAELRQAGYDALVVAGNPAAQSEISELYFTRWVGDAALAQLQSYAEQFVQTHLK